MYLISLGDNRFAELHTAGSGISFTSISCRFFWVLEATQRFKEFLFIFGLLTDRCQGKTEETCGTVNRTHQQFPWATHTEAACKKSGCSLQHWRHIYCFSDSWQVQWHHQEQRWYCSLPAHKTVCLKLLGKGEWFLSQVVLDITERSVLCMCTLCLLLFSVLVWSSHMLDIDSREEHWIEIVQDRAQRWLWDCAGQDSKVTHTWLS